MRIQVAALVVAALSTNPAHAQDGLATLKKIQFAYAGLKSYSQKISSTMTTKSGAQRSAAGQTSELRYKQPNQVFMTVSSPGIGSVTSYNNGREMFVYRSSINSYQKRPGKPDVKSYVLGLREFKITTMLDPLAFLTGEPVERAVPTAVVKVGESLNGVACNVIVGQLNRAFIGNAKSGVVTFWADKDTNLLRKILIVITGIPATARQRIMEKGKPVVKSRRLVFDTTVSMTVQELQINPPLTDASFTYIPPKGAIEQNPEKLLKK